jgi:hypothetical protein
VLRVAEAAVYQGVTIDQYRAVCRGYLATVASGEGRPAGDNVVSHGRVVPSE